MNHRVTHSRAWNIKLPPQWSLRQSRLIPLVREHRMNGEDLFDTARRLLVVEALIEAGGEQTVASEMLGCSPRVLNYLVRKYAGVE